MDTLADIIRHRDEGTDYVSKTDEDTPHGHFQVTAKIHGKVRIYLLEGDEGDRNSPIKGVIVISKDNRTALAFRSRHLRGGSLISLISGGGYRKVFAAIAEG